MTAGRLRLAAAIPLAALVAVAGLVMGGCSNSSPGSTASIGFAGSKLPRCPHWTDAPRSALPGKSLLCMDGSGSSTVIRGAPGVPTVLTLWAPWCTPCRAELPVLQRLQRHAAGRLQVVGVVTRGEPSPSVELAHSLGLSFPQLYDPDGRVLAAIGKQALPAIVLLRPDGTVASVYQGPALTDATARALVLKVLRVAVS
jgi:cytochrome c biogenesis protein CcmG/thiol:disulfide interchange protein DsbE